MSWHNVIKKLSEALPDHRAAQCNQRLELKLLRRGFRIDLEWLRVDLGLIAGELICGIARRGLTGNERSPAPLSSYVQRLRRYSIQ